MVASGEQGVKVAFGLDRLASVVRMISSTYLVANIVDDTALSTLH
jgi:hypothetical protein